MTRPTKYIVITLSALFVIILSSFGYWAWKYYILPDVADQRGESTFIPAMPDRTEYESLKERAKVALEFAKKRNMSTQYAFFVDYGVLSGTPRMYIWDFQKNEIVARTYVMHGPGKGSTDKKPVFSNELGSNCSALGRFLVTKQHGRINKTGFRLKGLDTDNQTAYRRALMIHGSKYLDGHVWMEHVPLNSSSCRGCVTVTSKGIKYIGKLVNSEEKPILLWNYYCK